MKTEEGIVFHMEKNEGGGKKKERKYVWKGKVGVLFVDECISTGKIS